MTITSRKGIHRLSFAATAALVLGFLSQGQATQTALARVPGGTGSQNSAHSTSRLAGGAHVTRHTQSTHFPHTAGGSGYSGGSDAFVTGLNSAGTRYRTSTPDIFVHQMQLGQATQAGPNLVVNGSFENPTGFAFYPQSIPGWTLCGGTNIEIDPGNLGTPEDGAQYTELNSDTPSAICQSIATVPGRSYQVTFWYSARAGTPATSNLMDVKWGGTDLTPTNITADGTNQTGTSWAQYTYTVTAASSSTQLKFADTGAATYNTYCDCGSLLDNVQVYDVPTPPTLSAAQNNASSWGGSTQNPITLTGTADPGATVMIYGASTGTCGTAVATGPADASGSFAIPVSNASGEGTYTYSATESMSAGPTVPGCSNAVTVTIDRTLPSSQITSPAISNSTPVYLNANRWNTTCGGGSDNICGTASDSGSGVAAVLVAIEGPNGAFWNGQTGSASKFDTAGTWVKASGTTSWGVNVPLPADGVYTVASAAVDNAGNVEENFQQSIAGLCTASQVSGSLSLNSGSLSINGGLCSVNSGTAAIAGGSCTVVDGSGNTNTFSLGTGSGSLSLNGGSLSLNGGSLSLNGGSLSLNGGSLSLNGGFSSPTASTPVLLSGGNCTLTASDGTSGSLSLNGGSLSLNGGSLSLNGGSLSLNGGSLSLNGGSLSLNGGAAAITGGSCTLVDASGKTNTFSLGTGSGSLSLNGGSLSLNGGSLSLNGGSLSLNGGSLSLNGGSLSLNGGFSPPTSSSTPVLLNGGNCKLTSNGTSGLLSLNGGSLSLSNTGSLSLNGGSLSLNGGSLSLNGGSLSLNGGSLSLNGGWLSLNGGVGSNTGNIVVDTTPPVVSSFEVGGQQTDGAQNIAPGSMFHIHFSKPMSSSTVNGQTITVSPALMAGIPTYQTPECDSGDPTCQSAVLSGFLPNHVYTVTVGSTDPGALSSSVPTDLAGNGLINTSANPATFHFTTGNDVAALSSTSDSDGDGIPDGWDGTSTPTFSLNGITTDTAALGFSPQHKDLCLVENYMAGTAANGTTYDQHITQAANQAIVNAFANAPVSNPDGTTGVHMVIFEGPYSAGLPSGYTGPYFGGKIGTQGDPGMVDPLGDASTGSFNWSSTWSGSPATSTQESFDDIRTRYFVPTGLSQFCHFALIAHTLGGSGSSGASRGINASDIVIALGGTVIGAGVGTQQEQEGTVMHELGHNLGLHHGGNDDVNYKPNYMSVMNYFYQFEGVPGGFTTNGLDYSHGTMAPLLESMLNDSVGLGSGALLGSGSVFGTRFFCGGGSTPNVIADAAQPINWGCSAGGPAASGTAVTSDVNGNGSSADTLTDYNDWANLNFKAGDIGYGAVPAPAKATSIDISTTAGGGADSAATIESNSVAKFTWTGFLSPLAADNGAGTSINDGKAGRTYPVKFQLKDASGNYVSTLSAVRTITYEGSSSCGTTATGTSLTSTSSTAGLHYDSTSNQYIYNWAAPTAAGCYMLKVNLADGSTYRALFSLS